MAQRSKFPKVFWVANLIEVLERFAYYGIYMSLGLYLNHLGFKSKDLGLIQSILLGFSYFLPLFSGTFADKHGFKKLLIISYIIYIPGILLLAFTDTLSGIGYAMLTIGFAAGVFKPLISATVRSVTDSTNKTFGFGIFYQMVNIGASVGPIVMGKLRGWDWDYIFYTAAAAMLLASFVTLLFYKEPKREIEGVSLKSKFRDIGTALSDLKFSTFLVLLGLFFWVPFWAFFNVLPIYIDSFLNTASLYESVKGIFGEWFTQKLISNNEAGVWRINAEAISHTGYIIIIFQLAISKFFEKKKAITSFLIGLIIATVGFLVLGFSVVNIDGLIFLGIFLFAVGEMISSPRIQEYVMWIAPKEKAGLYMGTNFLAMFFGATLSGFYTSSLDHFSDINHPEYIMYTLAAHTLLGILAIFIFTKVVGSFSELNE